MKVLVAYMSQTGNTKKIAEAIYSAIPQPKEIKRIEEVTSLEDYDLSFLGFPMRNLGPDKQVKIFLKTHVKDRNIALFITHMAPEDAPPLLRWIQNFKDAAEGANIIGVFNCQGQASRMIKIIMRIPLFFMGEADTSQGKPDAVRLERAKAFANEIMIKLTN